MPLGSRCHQGAAWAQSDTGSFTLSTATEGEEGTGEEQLWQSVTDQDSQTGIPVLAREVTGPRFRDKGRWTAELQGPWKQGCPLCPGVMVSRGGAPAEGTGDMGLCFGRPDLPCHPGLK